MIKLKKILIIIAIIILAGVGGLYLLGSSDIGNEFLGGFSGSFRDALLSGRALKCTWTEGEVTETAYIQGEDRIYVERTDADGTGYFLYTDNCFYSWAPGESQGLKGCFTPAEGEESVGLAEASQEGDLELDLETEYNCEGASLDQSRFVPPSGVQFLDYGDLFDFDY